MIVVTFSHLTATIVFKTTENTLFSVFTDNFVVCVFSLSESFLLVCKNHPQRLACGELFHLNWPWWLGAVESRRAVWLLHQEFITGLFKTAAVEQNQAAIWTKEHISLVPCLTVGKESRVNTNLWSGHNLCIDLLWAREDFTIALAASVELQSKWYVCVCVCVDGLCFVTSEVLARLWQVFSAHTSVESHLPELNSIKGHESQREAFVSHLKVPPPWLKDNHSRSHALKKLASHCCHLPKLVRWNAKILTRTRRQT